MPTVSRLDHMVLTVSDIAASLRFYEDALGMVSAPFEVADGTTRWALNFGAQKINLHPAETPFQPHARRPVAGSADLCFISAAPLADWQAHFAKMGLVIEEGPIARTGAGGDLMSVYLRDPDGNLIEVSNLL